VLEYGKSNKKEEQTMKQILFFTLFATLFAACDKNSKDADQTYFTR
jgi:hypothetical protein